ncbi:MAG TPA: hypothetical protein DDW27_12545 [Bacteroidales bacterium]|nr:hypothetical protein [Bacteroidales bacterium]
MARISIVMTFYQRQYQLNKTLLSIAKSNHKDFEVIIVDDCSTDDIILPEVPFKVTVIKIQDKQWTNPEPAYNTGIIEALKSNPDIIILQNAENYHEGDVLSYAERVNDKSYISFGCYSLGESETFSDHDIMSVIAQNDRTAVENGQNAWYNHPVHRPIGYDFCSAITARNLRKLNGYDERFSNGYAYGDDNLLSRVKKMGLKIEITASPFVVHQWHYSRQQLQNQEELAERNRNLFLELDKETNIRAKHIYTPDL